MKTSKDQLYWERGVDYINFASSFDRITCINLLSIGDRLNGYSSRKLSVCCTSCGTTDFIQLYSNIVNNITITFCICGLPRCIHVINFAIAYSQLNKIICDNLFIILNEINTTNFVSEYVSLKKYRDILSLCQSEINTYITLCKEHLNKFYNEGDDWIEGYRSVIIKLLNILNRKASDTFNPFQNIVDHSILRDFINLIINEKRIFTPHIITITRRINNRLITTRKSITLSKLVNGSK